MRDTKIPFGERDGVLLRAFEVENGLACNCVCPGCRKPLNAANRGLKVIPHFRHAQAEDCASGFKDGVRRAAVALIADQRRLMLPGYSRQVRAKATSGHILLRDVTFEPTTITAEAVERFVELGEVVAHAVLTALGRQLLVRIKVSARAEYERYQRLARIAGSSVEVDLSRLSLAQINDPVIFERAVLSDPDTRSWIRSLRGEMLEQHAAKELAAEVVAHDTLWEQEQGRLQAIENERREKQEAEANARAIALAAHRKAQLAAAEAQRVIGMPAKDEWGARQRREELIVGQTLRASQEWGGRAVECSACYIPSPPRHSVLPVLCQREQHDVPDLRPRRCHDHNPLPDAQLGKAG